MTVGPRRYTDRRFGEVLPDLLRERGWSQRRLAQEAGVDPAYISRTVGRAGRATAPELAARVASALGLPGDFFAECRERRVIEAIRSDPALRERIYRSVSRSALPSGGIDG